MRAGLALLTAVAGAIALTGVLYQCGFRPAWAKQFYFKWLLPNTELAEQAYERLLAGKTAEGRALFEMALDRDPASPFRWCEYGEALLNAGDRTRARECLLRGAALGPYVAPVQMRAVNFAYRTGDGDWALRAGIHLLGLVDAYDDAVFTVWDRMELHAARVVRAGLPDRRSAQSYLRHLMANGSGQDAASVWAWLPERSYADDRLADEYAAFLLRRRGCEAAVEAWAGYAGAQDDGYRAQTVVFNGSFEHEPMGTTFDWRTDPAEGAQVERDPGNAVAGRWSLSLRFDHTENVAFAHVWEQVCVEPGTYRFEARMRTEGITTDQGVGFRVFDPQAPQRVDVTTERLLGTHPWTALGALLTVGPATRLLEIRVVRAPSLKFDNKLGGTAWIDAVALRRQ
jgi:tetratricopeptide (TPR) repeat protein